MSQDKKKLLIVDDDEVFGSTLARALTRRGMQVSSATNTEQALQLLNDNHFDFMVLDLRLGTHSGLTFIEPALATSPGLKILLLTGYASLTSAVQAIKLGAFNYLAKPAGPDAILKALSETEAPDAEEAFTPTSLKQLEWDHLQRVLDENGGNISATARQLGMHRRTLQRKLQKKQLDIKPD